MSTVVSQRLIDFIYLRSLGSICRRSQYLASTIFCVYDNTILSTILRSCVDDLCLRSLISIAAYDCVSTTSVCVNRSINYDRRCLFTILCRSNVLDATYIDDNVHIIQNVLDVHDLVDDSQMAALIPNFSLIVLGSLCEFCPKIDISVKQEY